MQVTTKPMINVDVSQRSNAWLAWRAEGVTASDIPVILGLSPYKTPWRLWAEKTGRINPDDLSRNPHVQRGVRLEDEIRLLTEQRLELEAEAKKQVEKDLGILLLPVCGECGDHRFLRASFDGLDEFNKVYEFKCPSNKVFDDVNANGEASSAYQLYYPQVLAQCLVAGVSEGCLIFYKQGEEPISFDIHLNDEWITKIVEAATWFWCCVVDDIAPELSLEKDYFIPEFGNESFKWQANAESWSLLHEQAKEAEAKLAKIKADKKSLELKLIDQMGDFRLADFCGVKISRFERQGTIDYKKYLSKKHPDHDAEELENFRKKSSFLHRATLSKDELVNAEENGIILMEQANAYF